MSVKLSETGKLDGVLSWSLQARETCPGSHGPDGELVPACRGCYAVNGNYRYANVKAPRIHNRQDWKRDAWADDMVAALTANAARRDPKNNRRFFRWFDSGDVYCVALAEKILEVMERTPTIRHWLPTRSHKFPKIAAVLARMAALPNVTVRPSSDAVDGTFTPGVHGSCIVPTLADVPAGAVLCHAATHGSKCSGCRACYDKQVPVVAYLAHGVTMAKVIRISRAA